MSKRPAPPSAARLFDEPAAPDPPRSGSYVCNIDGAARGNPGPASYGVTVRDSSGAVVARLKKYIGRFTNNVAEYYALIAALDYAQAHNVRSVRIQSDSELLVKQMRGQYKVKSPGLRPLFERAKKMSQSFASFAIEHVYREQNREADALANEALDATAPGAAPTPHAAAPAAKPAPRAGKLEARRFRARYCRGALVLTEPLNIPEDSEVEIQVRLVE
ncbi:MAG: ribonuclease HI family protein [Acidobacteriia bacterium]|nr:ribonuclease HI family protein [Terriglobia bacterium]